VQGKFWQGNQKTLEKAELETPQDSEKGKNGRLEEIIVSLHGGEHTDS